MAVARDWSRHSGTSSTQASTSSQVQLRRGGGNTLSLFTRMRIHNVIIIVSVPKAASITDQWGLRVP